MKEHSILECPKAVLGSTFFLANFLNLHVHLGITNLYADYCITYHAGCTVENVDIKYKKMYIDDAKNGTVAIDWY